MKDDNILYEEAEDDAVVIHLGRLFGDVWKGICRFWWIFPVLIAVSASVTCLYGTVRYQPMYEAYASFMVITMSQSSGNEADTTYSFSYNRSTADQLGSTFPYILSSDILQDSLKEVLGTDKINGTITAKAVQDSNLITLRVVSNSQIDANTILDTVMEVLPAVSQYVIGTAQFQVIEESAGTSTPVNQLNRIKYAVTGAEAGFILGIVFLMGYALTRKTVRSSEDLKTLLNVPYLGAIPQVRRSGGKREEKNAVVSIRGSRAGESFAESVRFLQARVEHVMKQREDQVLLVTSTGPGEGKSTVSMNLALAMAQNGRKVILMDGDLRKPDLKDRLELTKQTASLTDVLSGNMKLDDAIVRFPGETFAFLGNSEPISKSVSVISSPEMKQLILELRKNADYIIIDVPPCQIMADTAHYWDYADGVLYVVKQDQVNRSQILNAVSELPENGAKLIGCVLNGVQGGLVGYGYGYGYGYGGYGSKKYGSHGYGYHSKGYGYHSRKRDE